MSVETVVFWGSASISLLSALLVVCARNPVRAVLSLVLTFFTTAITWLLLEAEFLAISLVLVYVGAVMVLFLFVVMMLDIELEPLKQAFSRYLPLGFLVAAALIGFLTVAIAIPAESTGPTLVRQGAQYSNVKALGEVLYGDYLFAFELAGVILLVAMVAAIVLTFRGAQKVKKQSIEEQVRVEAHTRIRLVEVTTRGGPDAST